MTSPSSTVVSPAGIRLLCGLLAPHVSEAAAAELETRWGLDATALHEETLRDVQLAAQDPALHLALGAWARDVEQVPALARERLGSLLAVMPEDNAQAQELLDGWASEQTGGLITEFPASIESYVRAALASAIAVDDTWTLPAAEQHGRFGDQRHAQGFQINNPPAQTRASADGRQVFVALSLVSGIELRVCASTEGVEHAEGLLASLLPGGGDHEQRLLVDVFERVARPGDLFTTAERCARPSAETVVWLPEFLITADVDVADEAVRWGLESALQSGGTPGLGVLEVSAVKQAAMIEVSKRGVRAAAVTVAMLAGMNLVTHSHERVAMDFSEPFAFQLVAPGSTVALFTGTLHTVPAPPPVKW